MWGTYDAGVGVSILQWPCLGAQWTLGFGLWTLRFPGSETLRKLHNLSELLFSICKFNENKVLATWNCCKDKTRVFVKCLEHGNYSVVAAANYFFWKFVALIAPYAHIFFFCVTRVLKSAHEIHLSKAFKEAAVTRNWQNSCACL